MKIGDRIIFFEIWDKIVATIKINDFLMKTDDVVNLYNKWIFQI